MTYRSYRVPSSDAIWFLIAINFVVFIATLINREIIYFLGLIPLNFLHRPWTIVTCLFVHGGFWHIMANMATLYFFGNYLIGLIGQRSFLLIYFLGGILGGIFYILLAPPFSIAIGASGAIFALGGTLAMIRPRTRVFVFPLPVPLPLWIAILAGFFILSFIPGVGWQAHLGGLVLGLIAGYILKKRGFYLF